jgi:hypothetical protein
MQMETSIMMQMDHFSGNLCKRLLFYPMIRSPEEKYFMLQSLTLSHWGDFS